MRFKLFSRIFLFTIYKPNTIKMIPEIFDIQNEQVVINHNCLSVPELKAVVEKYKDPIPALNFLHHLYSPKGPYCNTPEEEKEEVLIMDFPGEYTLEDDVMIKAKEKLETFLMTPSYRYYLDNKILLEKMGKFARTTAVTSGRDGNLAAFNTQIKSVGQTITQFKIMEKEIIKEMDELKAKVRGQKKKAYDQ